MEDATYDETQAELNDGDSVLLFSDGALEVEDGAGKLLGIDGLIALLKRQGYPQKSIRMAYLEEALLKYSNSIRLEDDLTLIEMRLATA